MKTSIQSPLNNRAIKPEQMLAPSNERAYLLPLKDSSPRTAYVSRETNDLTSGDTWRNEQQKRVSAFAVASKTEKIFY